MTTRVFNIVQGSLAPSDLKFITDSLKKGGVGAFPTDTVYGLGALAFSREGIQRIYDLKARDSRKALPILVHSVEEARKWVMRETKREGKQHKKEYKGTPADLDAILTWLASQK